MKKNLSIILLLLIGILLTAENSARQKTFNISNGSWGTASHWLPSGVPAITDTVTIPSGRTCTINVTAYCGLLIIETTGTLIVQKGLTVQSSSEIYGTISIASNSGTKTFTGAVTIAAGGSWTNPANEGITFRGGFTNLGSFTSGSGSYIFNGNQSLSGNQIIFNCDVSISSGRTVTNYTAVTITGNLTGGSSTSRFINSAGTVLNAGGSVMNTGQLTAGANGNIVNYNRAGNQTVKPAVYFNLILSGSGTKTTNNITINGELSLQGTARVSRTPAYGNSAVLEYKGSSAQTTGPEFPSVMNYQLIINNPSGVILNSSKTVNNNLVLVEGNITTASAKLLTIGAEGNITRETSGGFINGPLARIKNTGALQTLNFPIGKSSLYRPVEVNIQHTNNISSAYTAELFNSAPVQRSLPPTLANVSAARYWKITKSGGASISSASVVLYYDTADGISDPEDLRVAKNNGSAWVNIGGTAAGSPAGSILSGSFTSFSDFVLANASGGSNPLPVELNSFELKLKGTAVQLNWVTQTEVNNYGFDVERCSDEVQWTKIGFVPGNHNSNSPKEYSFTDKPISGGRYFYRLKQIDTDGIFHYSPVLEIIFEQVANDFLLSSNYPNPFNPSTSIEYSIPKESFVELKVYDITGNEVKTLVNEYKSAGSFRAVFNASSLSSGIYIARLTSGSFNQSIKMILMK